MILETLGQVLTILGNNAATTKLCNEEWIIGKIGIACTQTGCRVYQRILETPENYSPAPLGQFVKQLLDPVTFKVLVTDKHGNFVIQHILKGSCRPLREKMCVLDQVGENIIGQDACGCYFPTHIFAHHVVQRCFNNNIVEQIPGQRDQNDWRKRVKEILNAVFQSDGTLKPQFMALQEPKAKYVLDDMSNAFQHSWDI